MSAGESLPDEAGLVRSEPVAPPASPPDDAPLPLEALERALAPIRRVTRWASGEPDARVGAVRYLEPIGGRWLRGALALDLPQAVLEQLTALAGLLEGFDAADADERRSRITGMDQLVRRLDALLGLPVALPLPRPRKRADRAERADRGERAEGKGRRRRRERAEAEVASEAPPAPEPAPQVAAPPPFWDGSSTTSLSDLELPEALVDALADDDVQTAGQLLRRRPVGEELLTPVHGAGRDIPAGRVAVGGRVGARYTVLHPDGQRDSWLTLRGAGPLRARYTEPPDWTRGTERWLHDLAPEQRVVVVGDLDDEGILRDPEPATDDGEHTVRLPSYGVEGVDDRAVRALIRRLLACASQATDPVPTEILERLELMPLAEALAEVHQPGRHRERARRRMAFDELLMAQLSLSVPRYQGARDRGIPHPVHHTLASRLGGGEALVLDDAQQLALEEIKRDLRQPTPMLRVLLGEVGAGKGAVALMAAVTVAESKSQVLYLAPDRATAEQRFTFAEPLLREAGLVARLVDDGKRAMRDAIGRGEVHVAFGALDLLEGGLEFRRLGLVIAEEREHWGRASALIRKLRAPRPHALIVPRTPLGAAVALTAYSDHDLTVLESATRGEVAVEVVAAEERRRAYERAAEAIDRGRQVIVVFPMVQGADALTAREALRVVRALEEDALQGARVALYYGSSPRDERQRIYDDFRHRRSDVLVATSLVEDGPPVPDASVVVIEQADRVEASRLQRIRGFVSRGRHAATVLLVMGDRSDDAAIRRVKQLVEATDGFALHDGFVAEQGLQGIIAGDAPPLPRLVWAQLAPDAEASDPAGDRSLVWRAREVVHDLLAGDPTLRRGWGTELAKEARIRFDDLWPSDDGDGASWRCPIPDGGAPDRKRRRRRRRKR